MGHEIAVSHFLRNGDEPKMTFRQCSVLFILNEVVLFSTGDN